MKTDALKEIDIHMIRNDIAPEDAAAQLGLHLNYFRRILNGSLIPGKKAAMRIEEWLEGKAKAGELMQL